jgi:hypothetical protein
MPSSEFSNLKIMLKIKTSYTFRPRRWSSLGLITVCYGGYGWAITTIAHRRTQQTSIPQFYIVFTVHFYGIISNTKKSPYIYTKFSQHCYTRHVSAPITTPSSEVLPMSSHKIHMFRCRFEQHTTHTL